MVDRDMLYGGYCSGAPFNTAYGNFGFQGPPGSLMPNINNFTPNNGMIPNNFIPNNGMMDNNMLSSTYNDITTKLNELENRIRALEQKINNVQNDNSLYML